jgi:hypothetical protein
MAVTIELPGAEPGPNSGWPSHPTNPDEGR